MASHVSSHHSRMLSPPACPACGDKIPVGAQFCPGCGRAIKPFKGAKDSGLGPRTDQPLSAVAGTETKTDISELCNMLPVRYQPIKKLGQGGMGTVYLCQDRALERKVAIKIMTDRYRSDPQGERRFMREARAQATVNHPNVATVLNFGVSAEGCPFLVMEYLEGLDLRSIIRQEKIIEPIRACDMLRQVCEGLDEAHSSGLVHRDMKPSNLMIIKDHRGQPWVKILDLGLAKIMGGQTDLKSITMDTAGMLVGTPAYMSPEQVAGAAVDGRADIYSLGIVFYEMISGRLPFESETMEGWLYQHLHVKPPPPSQFNPELARFPVLDRLALWMMAKQPQERPAPAGELAAMAKRLVDRKLLDDLSYRPARKSGPRPALSFEDNPQARRSGPRAGISGPHAGISGPHAGISGPHAGISGPHAGISGPHAGISGPRASASGPRAGISGPRASINYIDMPPPPPDANARATVTGKEVTAPPPAAQVPQQDVEQRRIQYLQASKMAEKAESERRWQTALELWQQALPLADRAETVSARIEGCRREKEFEEDLERASAAARNGEWEAAEKILTRLSSQRNMDARIEQVRARMPQHLVSAWLGQAKAKVFTLPEGDLRQALLERLGTAFAQAGEMKGAVEVLNDATRKPEARVVGMAQAIAAAIQNGTTEGLRPYLEQLCETANELSDPSERGRAHLEIGRAMTCYGDEEGAGASFQSALTAFHDANSRGIPMQAMSRKSATITFKRLTIDMRSVSATSSNLSGVKAIRASFEAALGAVAQAQAEAGLCDAALATTALIDDAWTLAQTLSQVAQAFAKIGRISEAEKVCSKISFAMPKTQALRALAVSRVYCGEMVAAEDILKNISAPADKIALQGLLAAAWALRSETGRATVRVSEAAKILNDVVGARARFQALMSGAEPLLNSGFHDLADPLVKESTKLIDLMDDPAERLRALLQLAQIQENARDTRLAATRTMMVTHQPSAAFNELLRRALVVWRQVRVHGDRLECVEKLSHNIAWGASPELASEILATCRDAAESSLSYIGLSTGMI